MDMLLGLDMLKRHQVNAVVFLRFTCALPVLLCAPLPGPEYIQLPSGDFMVNELESVTNDERPYCLTYSCFRLKVLMLVLTLTMSQ